VISGTQKPYTVVVLYPPRLWSSVWGVGSPIPYTYVAKLHMATRETNSFVSEAAALKYFGARGKTGAEVGEMLRRGEIRLGTAYIMLAPGERRGVTSCGWRYTIVTDDP